MSKSNSFTRGDLIDAFYQEVPCKSEVLVMLKRPAKDRDTNALLRLAKKVVEKTEVGVLHVHVAALLALVPTQAMATAEARRQCELRKSAKWRKTNGINHFDSMFSELFNSPAQKEDQK